MRVKSEVNFGNSNVQLKSWFARVAAVRTGSSVVRAISNTWYHAFASDDLYLFS